MNFLAHFLAQIVAHLINKSKKNYILLKTNIPAVFLKILELFQYLPIQKFRKNF